MKVSVILPAAGLGTRMGERKQFLLLDGAPILVHTLRKFAASALVDEIVIATRRENLEQVSAMAEQVGGKPIRVVEGGETRQESVRNALAWLDTSVDIVAVHDAVRPFISVELIDKVIREAAATGAAIIGIVPVDTVKQVHLHSIRATIPREKLVLAQTPQVFRRELLAEAFALAAADSFTGTDEASLVERLDRGEVTVVQGSDRNIKITKPGDLALAELFLHEERAS
jgi:2-C-methyl-D-erythritol 4-phosphate cytidylyltransferase